MTTETNANSYPPQTTVDDQADRSTTIVYRGFRPFKIDSADQPVMPGDTIDEDHPYAQHAAALLDRVDFGVSNG